MPGRPAARWEDIRAAFYFLKVARAAAFIKKKGECLQEKKRQANVKRSAGRMSRETFGRLKNKKAGACHPFFNKRARSINLKKKIY